MAHVVRHVLRAIALFAVCAAALASAACTAPASGGSHVLRIADESDPDSLNPLLLHDQDTIGYSLLYCQTLIGLSAQNRLVPVLVTRIPTRANGGISADGLTITYHLKPGVRFADGTPLTSADVAFTYHAILDPHNPVLSQDAYRRIASLATPDPHTVVIRLRKPWNAAVSDLFAQSDFAFGILPAHAFTSTQVVQADWNQHPFGTGPFRVVEWRRGDRIVLEPNPYFSPKPKLARIELQMIPSATSGFVALRTGEVDVAPLLPSMLDDARALRSVRVLNTPENATIYLGLQTQAGPTDDVRVRRAISDALDLEAFRKSFNGIYPLAASVLPPVLQDHDASIVPAKLDRAKAAAELDAAGWRMQNGVRVKNGTPLDVILIYALGSDLRTRVSTVAQQQLAAVGMRVTIKGATVTLFNAPEGPLRNGRFALSQEGWLGGADPEQSMIWACSQVGLNGNNASRYCNPAYDALFRDQATTPDEMRRHDDFVQMQQIIHDDLPVVPLYYESYLEGVNARVDGFERNMLRFPQNVENWDVP